MKELEQYLGATYSGSCQTDIMTETLATFPDLEIPNIPDSGIERPRTDAEITYLEKKDIEEATRYL